MSTPTTKTDHVNSSGGGVGRAAALCTNASTTATSGGEGNRDGRGSPAPDGTSEVHPFSSKNYGDITNGGEEQHAGSVEEDEQEDAPEEEEDTSDLPAFLNRVRGKNGTYVQHMFLLSQDNVMHSSAVQPGSTLEAVVGGEIMMPYAAASRLRRQMLMQQLCGADRAGPGRAVAGAGGKTKNSEGAALLVAAAGGTAPGAPQTPEKCGTTAVLSAGALDDKLRLVETGCFKEGQKKGHQPDVEKEDDLQKMALSMMLSSSHQADWRTGDCGGGGGAEKVLAAVKQDQVSSAGEPPLSPKTIMRMAMEDEMVYFAAQQHDSREICLDAAGGSLEYSELDTCFFSGFRGSIRVASSCRDGQKDLVFHFHDRHEIGERVLVVLHWYGEQKDEEDCAADLFPTIVAPALHEGEDVEELTPKKRAELDERIAAAMTAPVLEPNFGALLREELLQEKRQAELEEVLEPSEVALLREEALHLNKLNKRQAEIEERIAAVRAMITEVEAGAVSPEKQAEVEELKRGWRQADEQVRVAEELKKEIEEMKSAGIDVHSTSKEARGSETTEEVRRGLENKSSGAGSTFSSQRPTGTSPTSSDSPQVRGHDERGTTSVQNKKGNAVLSLVLDSTQSMIMGAICSPMHLREVKCIVNGTADYLIDSDL